MNQDQEEAYTQMAQDNPEILCSEIPVELLEAASFSGEEPSEFLTQFLTAGHLEWLARRNGGRYHYEQERIDRAVYLLWDRACHLYTSHIMSLADADWNRPFFSDEGLY